MGSADKDHHPGYISWEQFERNQKALTENNFMRTGRAGKRVAEATDY
jgi:hypothetical protein